MIIYIKSAEFLFFVIIILWFVCLGCDVFGVFYVAATPNRSCPNKWWLKGTDKLWLITDLFRTSNIYIFFAVCVVRNKSDFVLYVFANWLVGPYLTVMTLTAQPAEASCSKDAAKYYLPSTVIGEQAFGVNKACKSPTCICDSVLTNAKVSGCKRWTGSPPSLEILMRRRVGSH